MTIQTLIPVALALGSLGLGLAATLWGEDSAMPAATARDGRAVRSALKPE
jgi:hypothetical protein